MYKSYLKGRVLNFVLLGLLVSLTSFLTVSFPETAHAATAVAFDAVGPSVAGISVVSGSSLSWNHTVTSVGSNLLLTVGVAVGANPDSRIVSVTYNGVSMNSVGKVHSNNRTSGFVELFYLKAPGTGTHTVQVTLTGGNAAIEGGSVSFTGVDQTTPVRNVATAFGSGTNPNVSVASAVGDMVVDAVAYGCGGGSSAQTSRWKSELNCATAGGCGAQSTAPGAPSVNMRYTITNDWWGIIGHGKFVLPPFILPPGWWRRSFPSYVSSRGPAGCFCEVA
jgi:hypothetical protein